MQYKFRGKRKDNNEWVYGSLLIRGNKSFIIVLIESRIPDYSVENSAGAHGYTWAIEEVRCEVVPETVSMMVAVKDKRGNEIYGGDIMATDGGITVMADFVTDNPVLTMGWCLKNFTGFSCMFTPPTGNHCEIIGNIHDHPHLLTPSQKGDVLNTMQTDPNLKAEEQATQEAEGQINAAESAAQDAAVGAEESTEG